ncbi:MAG: exopolysaccharide biosynthesis polyprenyl glycosylphosphotransferase [Pseudomonadota bacterium]
MTETLKPPSDDGAALLLPDTGIPNGVHVGPQAGDTRRDDIHAQHRRAWSHRVVSDIVGAIELLIVAFAIVAPAMVFTVIQGVAIDAGQLAQTGLIAAVLYHLLNRVRLKDQFERLDIAGVGAARTTGTLSVVFLASLGLGIPIESYNAEMLAWYVVWLSASVSGIVALRSVSQAVVRDLVARGWFDRRIAIYGAGTIAKRVQAFIAAAPRGFILSGVYDDRSDPARTSHDGLPPDGGIDALISEGRSGAFDAVIIALPQSADRRIAEISRQLEQLPTSLHVVTHMAPDLVDQIAQHDVSSVGPVGLLDVKQHPHADWAPIVKRIMDLMLSVLFLIPLLPIMLLIAFAIRLDSPGPALFRQRRRGYNHTTFKVVKFRTMRVLEDGETIRQAQSDDDRVTRVGWFLRRSSLDELPQLWNVLWGEMSLVGPRPHAVAHDDAWGAMHARYANRNQVKPGITGLAQVAGARGEITADGDLEKRVLADLNYIAHWSPWLDLTIMVRTVFAILRARNAH